MDEIFQSRELFRDCSEVVKRLFKKFSDGLNMVQVLFLDTEGFVQEWLRDVLEMGNYFFMG